MPSMIFNQHGKYINALFNYDDDIYILPLPNIHCGTICLGTFERTHDLLNDVNTFLASPFIINEVGISYKGLIKSLYLDLMLPEIYYDFLQNWQDGIPLDKNKLIKDRLIQRCQALLTRAPSLKRSNHRRTKTS